MLSKQRGFDIKGELTIKAQDIFLSEERVRDLVDLFPALYTCIIMPALRIPLPGYLSWCQKIDKIHNPLKKGDLLLSLRQMHMLVILDRNNGDLLWHKVGPWVRQHDPDIDQQGNITVYNNRAKQLVFDGEIPYSNILKYYPESDRVEVLYPKSGDADKQFYSDIMGTHQLLENGNLLISETKTGRVFEANSQGEIVWEYIERYKKYYAALIESGERFQDDYFSEVNWDNCSAKTD